MCVANSLEGDDEGDIQCSPLFDALAKTIRKFESRPGQLEMAQAVEVALSKREHLAVEAPCGIGKSFAYLVPAIRHAVEKNETVVVATANIALQEQLIEKDLPALAKALPDKFSFALIKGISNYLCLDRFQDASGQTLLDPEERRRFEQITAWAGETKTGDRSDLDFEPRDTWPLVNGVSELCTASRCHLSPDCFAMEARRRLQGATVIVCNYHLLFAHLKIKMEAERDVILPPIRTLICDEAHDMAAIAREFFGMRLTPRSIAHLVRAANALGRRGVADRLRKESRNFFDDVAKNRGRLRKPGFADGEALLHETANFARDLELQRKASQDDENQDKLSKYLRATASYQATLEGFLSLDDENMAYWVESDAALHSALIDVSDVLKSQVFDAVESVILTSATLTTGGSFDFLRSELGLEKCRDLAVSSPFDMKSQCRVVVPRLRHSPNEEGFVDELSRGINAILKRLGGRTMCLFTSYRNLDHCAAAAEDTGVRILRQGEKPRKKLLSEFRKDRKSALFATASFWRGIDIPGEALSCLVIDKLPFAPPDEPLQAALRERDPRYFSNYALPRAILDLRQGFGRLIRRKDDRGVVVIFDRRLYTARYGPVIRRSLPNAPMTRDLSTLDTFFGS